MTDFVLDVSRIGRVMVDVLSSSVVDRGFESRSGQTKGCKISICFFSAKYVALRSKSNDWFDRNRYKVSKVRDMSSRCLLFQ